MLVPFKSLPKNSRIWIFPSIEFCPFTIDKIKIKAEKKRIYFLILKYLECQLFIAETSHKFIYSSLFITKLLNTVVLEFMDFDFANFTKSFRVKYTISLLLSLYKTFILSNKIKSNSFSKICIRFINESIEHPEAF